MARLIDEIRGTKQTLEIKAVSDIQKQPELGIEYFGKVSLEGQSRHARLIFETHGSQEYRKSVNQVLMEINRAGFEPDQQISVVPVAETRNGTLICVPYVDRVSDSIDSLVKKYTVDEAHRYFKSARLIHAQVKGFSDLDNDPYLFGFDAAGNKAAGYLKRPADFYKHPDNRSTFAIFDDTIRSNLKTGDKILARIHGFNDGLFFFSPAYDILAEDYAVPGELGVGFDGYVATKIVRSQSKRIPNDIFNVYAARVNDADPDDAVGFLRRGGPSRSGPLSKVIIKKGAPYVGEIIPHMTLENSVVDKERDIIYAMLPR